MTFGLPGKKYPVVPLVLAAGAILSLLLFVFVRGLQIKHFEYEFGLKASDRTEVIADAFQDHVDLLYYIAGLFDARQRVERGEFRDFTRNILLMHPDIMALAWLPRVRELEILGYEIIAYRDGIQGFRLQAIDKHGRPVKPESKEEYFPVYYVEPYEENKAILGLDLSSEPSRWQAMQKARDTGLPVATSSISLARDNGSSHGGPGYRIFMPVYRKAVPLDNPRQRRESLYGFISLLFRVSSTIELRLKTLSAIGMDIYIFNKAEDGKNNLIYFHRSRTRAENIRPLKQQELAGKPFLWTRDIDIAGNKWSLVCVPAPKFFARYYTLWQAWLVLAAGLLLTLFLAYHIFKSASRSESQLRKLSRAVEQSPSIVMITDTEGGIEYVNPKFTQVTGYAPEEVVGKNARILKSGEISLDGYRGLWEELLAGKEWRGEFHNVKKNGEFYWESASISSIRDAHGKTEHYLKVSEDITERKRLEGMKDEFVSNVSHEIRTPLSIIKEAIEIILEKLVGGLNQKQEEMLNTARENIGRLSRIINELLDISKIEAGKLQLYKSRTDIAALVAKAVLAFGGRAKEKGLELEQDFSSLDIFADVDADKITQVFMNLLSNAVKFTDKGSIKVSVVDKGAEIECYVQDTGRGIESKDLPKVFDKFQQFGRISGPGEKGTGLGLSIVKGIVEGHGGSIRVESGSGRGAKFIFTLPK